MLENRRYRDIFIKPSIFLFITQATTDSRYILYQSNTIYQQVSFTTTEMSYTAFLTAAISLMMTLAVAQPVPVPAEAETAKVDVSLFPVNGETIYGPKANRF